MPIDTARGAEQSSRARCQKEEYPHRVDGMNSAAPILVRVRAAVRPIARRVLAVALGVLTLSASEYRGQVKFGGLPVPGATIVARQGDKAISVVSDAKGNYSFPDLADGAWTVQVEMPGFAPLTQEITIAGATPAGDWNLKMLTLEEMGATAAQPASASVPSQTTASVSVNAATTEKPRKGKTPPAPTNTQTAFQRADVNAANNNAASATAPGGDATTSSNSVANQNASDLSQRAADGLLINGTTNNAASSPFAQAQAFGNNRRGVRSQYNGNIGIIFDDSIFDARNFSITGQDTPKLAYDHLQGVFAFGGPLKIPHVVRDGGQFFINYQWTRNRTATLATGLVPTQSEREGIIPGVGIVPIVPQAQALLNLYPLPNFSGGTRYNYQTELLGNTHMDSLQTRYNKTIGRKNFFSAQFALQSNRSDNPNLFGFLDTSRYFALNGTINFRHSFSPRFFTNFGLGFNRYLGQVVPFFANRDNVSGKAGIEGNNQSPLNWGPPTLNFANGITGLTDGFASHFRPQTGTVSIDNNWSRSRHNINFGGDFRRQQFNLLTQQDPRGTFTFTGAATGSALGDFFAGIPDTSSIAFGNADKYLRSSIFEAYVNDDWRVTPGFTLNAGVRWEYWSPITEKYGRLVNLAVGPGFTSETPVCATAAAGCISASQAGLPTSLMRPDKRGIQPRVAISWRPFAASSLVVRAGYGVYYNTSAYYTLATEIAQQPPLSKSLNVANSPEDALTLANGFGISPTITPNTVAVDPNFRPGYSQNWQASIQRDLPAALVLTVTYQGSKGTHQVQDFLPNTYPLGAVNPCPTCPTGFQYITSNGNSTREAGQVQLRRRLQAGFTATLQYTYAKAIDNAALGGRNQGTPLIAQNWLDLSAERGLSSFDQRHLLNLQIQYTTGMGLRGGTLVNGWRGALFKQWTAATQINAGTGLPLTPTYIAPVPGTGVTGPLRPEYTGAPLYAAPSGLALNPAAYAIPASGEYGNAGRDSITGPSQFTLNASLGRVFQLTERFGLDFRVDATNAFNHVTFPNWITTINSTQFGLPTAANPMRSVQTTIRLRF
jgi:trimeric autotransporter adhesin